MATKSLISVDRTAELYKNESHFVGNQQYRIGATTLIKGKKFVLLPGRQYNDPFSREGGDQINVFKFRALMLDSDGEFTGIVDGIPLSTLVKSTYGKCERDEDGKMKPYPKVSMTVSKKGNLIPESFGYVDLNCGWNVRKAFVGKDLNGEPQFDCVIDKPQAFEVVNVELHYMSVFDEVSRHTAQDDEGFVLMKPKVCHIIKPIPMPKDLEIVIKEAAL